ncbi:hypothetical protein BGW42_005858 [Actinomortierella wolfii]|nr:hypothetical protein BGW42_005858 [Actinomortierella wolfii]
MKPRDGAISSTTTLKASERALCIPEILDSILRCCSKRSLATCCRVSKLWYRFGIPLLWYSVQFDRESDVSLSESSLKPDPELNAQRLASLCKYGTYVRHLKPWPGLVESDFDVMSLSCGSHLETLDLSCTSWREREENVYLTRYKPSTWDLISLIIKLPQLRTLVLNLCIGLDMNEILRCLIALRKHNRMKPARPVSAVESSLGRKMMALASHGNTSAPIMPSWLYPYPSLDASVQDNSWRLDRLEMDWSKGLREVDLIMFLEICCSTYVGYQYVPGKGMKRVVRRGIRHLIMRYVSLERCTFRALNSPKAIQDASKEMASVIAGQPEEGEEVNVQQGNAGTGPCNVFTDPNNHQQPWSYSTSSSAPRLTPNGSDTIRPLSLTTLNLEYTRLTDVALCNIVKRCQNLLVLNVSKNPFLTKASMNYIARYCPRLFSINLSYGVKIENQGFITIFQRCTALRKVYVSHTLIQDSAIYALLGSTPHTSPDDTNTSGSDATYVFTHNRRLLSLDISACCMITHRAICRVVQNSLDLDTLVISQNKQIEVADIFPNRNIFEPPILSTVLSSGAAVSDVDPSIKCYHGRPQDDQNQLDGDAHDSLKDKRWVCLSLTVLNMADITYTPGRNRPLYIRDVYSNMYRQIQELGNLRSLHLGNSDFIVDLPMSIFIPVPSLPKKNPARRHSAHLQSAGGTSNTTMRSMELNGIDIVTSPPGSSAAPRLSSNLGPISHNGSHTELAAAPLQLPAGRTSTSTGGKFWRAGKALTMPTSHRASDIPPSSSTLLTPSFGNNGRRTRSRPVSMIVASAVRSVFRHPRQLTRRQSSWMDLAEGREVLRDRDDSLPATRVFEQIEDDDQGSKKLTPIPMLPWPKDELNLLHMLSKLHRLEALTISSMERPGVRADLFGLKELGLLANKLSRPGRKFHVEVGIRGATANSSLKSMSSSPSSLGSDETSGGNHDNGRSSASQNSQSMAYVELKGNSLEALAEQEAQLMGKEAVITNVVTLPLWRIALVMPARTAWATVSNNDDEKTLSLQPPLLSPPPPPRRGAMEHALSLPEILCHIFYCLDLSEEATANDYGLSSTGHVHGHQVPASSSASMLLSSKSHSGVGHDRMMCKTGSLRACALVSRFWYQACKPILWRKVHYSKSNLGAMVIHLQQPYDSLHHNKRARSSRHSTAGMVTTPTTKSSVSHSKPCASVCSQSSSPPLQGVHTSQEPKSEHMPTEPYLEDPRKYLLDQIPMGRFLPGMIQNARLIRHLKPWPGFLHRDLELIGDLCGLTLESLDLSLTRWSSTNQADMLAYMARHHPSSAASSSSPSLSSTDRLPPLAGHKDPVHISPATTKSLEQLLSKLTRLQALSVNHAIGLDMNEVLRFLTRMFSEEWERLEEEDSFEQRWANRRGSSSSSSSSVSSSTSSPPSTARSSVLSPSGRRLSLRRFEMNGQQNYDEETLVAFLETCCAFPRQYPSSVTTTSVYLSPSATGSTMHNSTHHQHMLKDSIPGIRSLSIKSNALSASLDGLWAVEVDASSQSSDDDSMTSSSSMHAGNFGGGATGSQFSTANNTAQQKHQYQHQHHHGPLQLEELFLDNNNLSSLTLHNLTRRCPFLHTITLSNNRRLTSLGMHVLAENCPLLRVVHLDGCISIDNGGFQQLFLRCTELEDVRLSRTSVDDVSILALLGESQDHLHTSSSLLGSTVSPTSPGTDTSGGVWATQPAGMDPHNHSTATSAAATRPSLEKRSKLRCLHLQNCSSITERSVRVLLTHCTSLESLDISQNRQLKVTDLFHSSDSSDSRKCLSCNPHGEAERWACSQTLRYLDISDIDYTPLQDQYELRACRGDGYNSMSGSTLTTFSAPNAVETEMSTYYLEVERVYQGMYDQLSALVHLQSLSMGSHDFVLVLEPPSASPSSSSSAGHAATLTSTLTGQIPPLAAATSPAAAPLPARDGLIRVLRSLKNLHLMSLSKIDVEQSTMLGFKELRWMIENIASPTMRQLLLGQGLGFSTGFGNGIVETNRRYKAGGGAGGPGMRSPSPVLLPPSPLPVQQGLRTSSIIPPEARRRTPSPDLNGMSSTPSMFGATSHGGSAMGLIDMSSLSPPSLIATEETLVFSRHDQLEKVDEVERNMDSSEAFMAWCRTTRPLLRVCVLEW